MSGPSRRLFVAVDLPSPLADRLAALAPTGRGVKPVRPESIHLTLHFLGDVPVAAIPGLRAALDEVRASPFAVELAGRGRFPPRGPSRVLWVGLAPQASLTALHAACGRAIQAAGLPVESRPFAPHITIARLHDTADTRLAEAFLAAGSVPAAFPVERVVLYASDRTPSGPRHEPLHTIPLSG
ncbi:MAG: RNA 2',3'-cyclic phosphodiesterase [Planctomycetota bacterium]